MKLNGYEFTEEDKKTYKDFLDLCGRIWANTNQGKMKLEYGSSDYPFGQQYPRINFDDLEKQLSSNTKQHESWDSIFEEPKNI